MKNPQPLGKGLIEKYIIDRHSSKINKSTMPIVVLCALLYYAILAELWHLR